MKYILSFLLIFMCSCTNNHLVNSRVPAWAKKAIWYQIFPERFANGDKSNDPTAIELEGAWPYKMQDGWQISSWTSDWYKLQKWEKDSGHDFYWNSGTRRYGGDIQGIIDKLDYLEELGITAIYLNPIFSSRSLHKYDTENYRHVDPNFGPNPTRDRMLWAKEDPSDESTWQITSADSLFLELIKDVHKRGMKIIVDGVFNHVGNTFWAFQDVIKNQEKSLYKDWFYIKEFDDTSTSQNEFNYQGWFGVKDLPEIREDDNGIVNGPRQHIFKIVKRWMDPNNDGNPDDGIDGWRLDVADMVNHNFWKDFRIHVKSINPNSYIVGEVWWEDHSLNKMYNASPWLKGDEFDAVMNYRFARALKNFISDKKNKINADAFIDSLKNQYRDYDKENLSVLMNLFDSHDTERLASYIVNPDVWFDHGAVPKDRKNWDVRKPNPKEIKKQKLMMALQMCLPGAPHIYYGDEVGMWGGDDPDCRKPMIWENLKYDNESTHPFGKERKSDVVKFDKNLFDFYAKLINIRKEHDELSLGSINFIDNVEKLNLLIFSRVLNNQKIYVILNSNENSIKLDISKNKSLSVIQNKIDLVSGKKITDSNELIILPYTILIIK